MDTRRGRGLLVAGLGAALLLTTASECQSASQVNPQLEKAAKAVPVPDGLTFTGFSHETMELTYEADANYTNATMSCDQLRAAWLSVLKKAGRAVTDMGPQQIFIKSSSYVIIIYPGGFGDCSKPYVSVQTK